MPNTGKISEFDHNGAQVILKGSGAIAEHNPINWVIEKLKHLPVDEQQQDSPRIPTPKDIIMSAGKAFTLYHGKVLRDTSHWSLSVKNGVAWTSNQILHPLSFCKIGIAIQHAISHDILGSVAQSIAFCALQILHLLPYVFMGAFTAGVLTLYHSDPLTLTVILAGGMLTTQLWFIFRLVKTVEATKKILEVKADAAIAAIDLVQIAQNTGRSLLGHGVRGFRWCASWLPTKQKESAQAPVSQ